MRSLSEFPAQFAKKFGETNTDAQNNYWKVNYEEQIFWSNNQQSLKVFKIIHIVIQLLFQQNLIQVDAKNHQTSLEKKMACKVTKKNCLGLDIIKFI